MGHVVSNSETGSNSNSLFFAMPSFTNRASSATLQASSSTLYQSLNKMESKEVEKENELEAKLEYVAEAEKAAESLYPNKGINLINYYQNYLDKSKDYAMIIIFNLFGALLLISSFDFISLYLSIELQSFALYILATFYKESRIVTAAGLKYFLLGALSSCFILLGSALIYAFSGLTKFDSIYLLISSFDPSVNHTQFTFGLVLIFIGFLFKIGAAPLHN
jgi:NADH:ubiquinone oxidoreductase subunit 2 (subunit N)